MIALASPGPDPFLHLPRQICFCKGFKHSCCPYTNGKADLGSSSDMKPMYTENLESSNMQNFQISISSQGYIFLSRALGR